MKGPLITMEGYDKRRELTKPVAAKLWNVSNGALQHVGRAFQKSSEIISYRDEPRGEIVLESDIDPYGSFLRREAIRKSANAQKAEATGSEFELLRDNGHPFILEKRTCRSTPNGQSNLFFNGTSLSSKKRGSGPMTAQVTLKSSASPLFKYKGGNNGQGSTTKQTSAYIDGDGFEPEATGDYGKRALVLTNPLKPDFDLFRALGELERAPALPLAGMLAYFRRSTRRDSDALAQLGSEWLNLQFGLIPTFNDLIDLLWALETATNRLLQIRRDAGKVIRRRHSVPTAVETRLFTTEAGQLESKYVSLKAFGFAASAASTSTAQRLHTSHVGDVELFQSVSTKYTFSGAFTYYLPVDKSLLANHRKWMNEMERVIRLGPSEQALWELTPWSWLIDWFIAVGSSIDSAVLAKDNNLVVNYGYAMREVTMASVVRAEVVQKSTRKNSFNFVRTQTQLSRKERVRANPYGFITSQEVDWDAYKLGILAALGLTRLS
jgi:hypothetical protein